MSFHLSYTCEACAKNGQVSRTQHRDELPQGWLEVAGALVVQPAPSPAWFIVHACPDCWGPVLLNMVRRSDLLCSGYDGLRLRKGKGLAP